MVALPQFSRGETISWPRSGVGDGQQLAMTYAPLALQMGWHHRARSPASPRHNDTQVLGPTACRSLRAEATRSPASNGLSATAAQSPRVDRTSLRLIYRRAHL